jgi:hypothetical protein
LNVGESERKPGEMHREALHNSHTSPDWDDKVKKDQMDGSCSTDMNNSGMLSDFCPENLKR